MEQTNILTPMHLDVPPSYNIKQDPSTECTVYSISSTSSSLSTHESTPSKFKPIVIPRTQSLHPHAGKSLIRVQKPHKPSVGPSSRPSVARIARPSKMFPSMSPNSSSSSTASTKPSSLHRRFKLRRTSAQS